MCRKVTILLQINQNKKKRIALHETEALDAVEEIRAETEKTTGAERVNEGSASWNIEL